MKKILDIGFMDADNLDYVDFMKTYRKMEEYLNKKK
jgi:hypothetical protein